MRGEFDLVSRLLTGEVRGEETVLAEVPVPRTLGGSIGSIGSTRSTESAAPKAPAA